MQCPKCKAEILCTLFSYEEGTGLHFVCYACPKVWYSTGSNVKEAWQEICNQENKEILWRAREKQLLAESNRLLELTRKYRTALSDAIRRPMGIIPNSAEGLVNYEDLEQAENRRNFGDFKEKL